MERRGSITSGMAGAADHFRTQFAMAQLDPLKAIDWSRPRQPRNLGGFTHFGGGGGQIEVARTAVWNAVLAVGGLGSPAGSVLWHVVGWEKSLKEWALEQGWSGQRQVSKLHDKRAALVDLGRHLGIFEKQQSEVQVTVDVVDLRETVLRTLDRLAAARAAAGGGGGSEPRTIEGVASLAPPGEG